MLAAGLALVAASAAIHATAQALIKGARDKGAFAWLMLASSSLLGFPLVFTIGRVEPLGWLIVCASGAVEALYYATLAKAYSLGDFSSVYPVARGSGPLFTLLWAALFLGERPSVPGLAGVLLIVTGIYLAALPSLKEWSRPWAGPGGSAAPWALATGLLISVYTTLDKAGMGHFEPAAYLYLLFAAACAFQAPFFLGAAGRKKLAAELSRPDGANRPEAAARPGRLGLTALDPRALGRVLLCAGLAFAAYCLVLAALRLAPAGYVASTREMGVVFGAWIGVRFFRERGGRLRIAASALILAGVVLIALSK